MPPKGHKFGPETRRRMSAAHAGKPRPYLRKPLATAMSEKTDKGDGADGCWNWTGAKFKGTGYGQIQVNGRPKRAHRVAWELSNGPVPAGVLVLHRCDNPSCVNPTHLFLGDHQANYDDMVSKGRRKVAAGERVGSSKMTAAEVVRARRLFETGSHTVTALARMFGITGVPMKALLERVTWKHVE